MFNFTINLVESRHLYLTLSSSSVAHLALSLPTPTLSITVHERAHWLLSLIIVVSFYFMVLHPLVLNSSQATSDQRCLPKPFITLPPPFLFCATE